MPTGHILFFGVACLVISIVAIAFTICYHRWYQRKMTQMSRGQICFFTGMMLVGICPFLYPLTHNWDISRTCGGIGLFISFIGLIWFTFALGDWLLSSGLRSNEQKFKVGFALTFIGALMQITSHYTPLLEFPTMFGYLVSGLGVLLLIMSLRRYKRPN